MQRFCRDERTKLPLWKILVVRCVLLFFGQLQGAVEMFWLPFIGSFCASLHSLKSGKLPIYLIFFPLSSNNAPPPLSQTELKATSCVQLVIFTTLQLFTSGYYCINHNVVYSFNFQATH